MSKFIQIYFFHHSTFPLPTKQKGEKIKSLLSSHNFLSSHFSTSPTKQIISVCLEKIKKQAYFTIQLTFSIICGPHCTF